MVNVWTRLTGKFFGKVQFDTEDQHRRVTRIRKFCYGMGSFGQGLTDFLAETFIMTFYTVILKVDPLVAGVALFWPRILDAVTDPLMGIISDRTRTRWGRRRPYLLFGGPLVGLFTFLLFAPPTALSENSLAVYMAIVSGLYYLAYTVLTVPYSALGAEISIEYSERTRVQTWRTVLGTLATPVVSWTWWLSQREVFPDEVTGIRFVAGVFGVLIVVATWISFAGTREQVEIQDRGKVHFWAGAKALLTNVPFLLLVVCSVFYYCGLFTAHSLATYVSIFYVFGGTDHEGPSQLMGLGATVAMPVGILSTIAWGWLGVRIGKKKAFILGLFFVALVSPLSWVMFTPKYPYLQIGYQAILGIAFGGAFIFPAAMMADICDFDEIKTGARREGSYSGIMGLIFKIGFSFPGIIAGVLLGSIGFNEDIEAQSVETLTQLRVWYALLPTAICLITAAVFAFYPLSEKRVRQLRYVLDRRHAKQEAWKRAEAELKSSVSADAD